MSALQTNKAAGGEGEGGGVGREGGGVGKVRGEGGRGALTGSVRH